MSSLNISRYDNSLVNFVTIEGSFDQQWEKYNNHLSNLPVLNTQFENIFLFIGNVSEVEIENEISSMTEKKASEQFHISSKVIKVLQKMDPGKLPPGKQPHTRKIISNEIFIELFFVSNFCCYGSFYL